MTIETVLDLAVVDHEINKKQACAIVTVAVEQSSAPGDQITYQVEAVPTGHGWLASAVLPESTARLAERYGIAAVEIKLVLMICVNNWLIARDGAL